MRSGMEFSTLYFGSLEISDFQIRVAKLSFPHPLYRNTELQCKHSARSHTNSHLFSLSIFREMQFSARSGSSSHFAVIAQTTHASDIIDRNKQVTQ